MGLRRMKTQLTWFRADETRPQRSGEVFVIARTGTPMVLGYSAKYRKFNVQDTDTPERAQDIAIPAAWWAYVPAEVLEEGRRAWNREAVRR